MSELPPPGGGYRRRARWVAWTCVGGAIGAVVGLAVARVGEENGTVECPVVEARAEFGILEVTSTPLGAEVFVDDVYVGRTPVQRISVRRGRASEVVVRRTGYRDEHRKVFLRGEESLRLTILLHRLKASS